MATKKRTQKRSPRVRAWLEGGGRGEGPPSADPNLRAFETSLAKEVGTKKPDHWKERAATIFGSSSLSIGQALMAKKFSGIRGGPDLVDAQKKRWPIIAEDSRALYAIDDSGRVLEHLRSRNDPARPFANSLDQFLERAVLREHARYREISWTAPAKLAPKERPSPFATGKDETWWDEGSWIAVSDGEVVTVWFDSESAATTFFASPRGEGTLRGMRLSKTKKNASRPPLLTTQLDAKLSVKVVKELKKRRATRSIPKPSARPSRRSRRSRTSVM